MRLWMRLLGVGAVALAAGAVPLLGAQSPKRVVMISVDGMMPAYYLQADALGLRIPNLRHLMGEGAFARVQGVLPTVTYPSHTTLITGVPPRVHGIGNNRLFDVEERSNGAWRWYANEVQVPTLVSAARARGLKTGSVWWPVSVGTFADDNMPEIWRTGSDHPADLHLLEALSTPGLFAAVEKERGHPFTYPFSDGERTEVAIFILTHRRPDLLLLHIAELDEAEHQHGPLTAEAKAALETGDENIGKVLAALDATSMRSETMVVVVSDHGFLPVSRTILPNTLLREAGLLEVNDKGKIVKWQAAFQAAGGSAALHVKEGAPSDIVMRVRALLEPRLADPANGLREVLDARAVEAMGGIDVPLVLNGREGFVFGDGATGNFLAPATLMGTHGHAPNREELQASLLMAGPGIPRHGDLGVVPMTSIAPTLAQVWGLTLDSRAGPPLQ